MSHADRKEDRAVDTIMRLPLLFSSFAGGLLLASFFPPWPILPPLMLVFGFLWLICHRLQPRFSWLLPLLFCGLGAALYHLHLPPPQTSHHISAYADQGTVTIHGTVLSVLPREESGCRIDLEARQVFIDSTPRPCNGRLRLHVEEGEVETSPGNQIRFAAKLRRPELFGTPGEFDYPRHLASQGIFATAFVGQSQDIVSFGSSGGGRFLASVARFRQRIGRQIDQSVDPELAPLVRALAIGDKQSLSTEQTSLMARAGISHLFAISGLHLGLVGMMLFGLGRLLYRRSEGLLLFQPMGRLLPLLLLPPLWLYLQVTGNALSARRAFFMLALVALLLPFSRRTPPIRILLAVAFGMLCWQPLSFFEPSFQLSFAGVLGILVFLPRWKNLLNRLPRPLHWPSGVAAATLAATLTTLPLVLLHFHLWAPAGLLTNLLAVPLIGLGAVPTALAGMLVTTFWPAAGTVLLQLSAGFTAVAWQIAQIIVDIPPLSGKMVYLSPALLGAVFCGVLYLLLPSSQRFRGASLLVLAGMVLTLALSSPSARTLSVTALSVGQGEALLLTRPDGGHYLIDGGGFARGTFDTGARLVGPALGRLGVRSLEAVILTHDHPDHRLGLIHILENFPVRSFWCTDKIEQLHPDLQRTLTAHRIPLKTFPPGWTFPDRTGEEPALAVFVPDQPKDHLNDRSLVLYAKLGKDGVLLTGDLEKSGVEELLAKTPEMPVTLLKLPHHGSRFSNPCALVDRFGPQEVFTSQGRNNPYGFPHAEVEQSLRQRGLTLYRTDLHRTLKYVSQGDGWHRESWRDGLFR
jgi:competence protein ComEC